MARAVENGHVTFSAEDVFSCIPLALGNKILMVPGLSLWVLSTLLMSIFDGGASIAKLFTAPALPPGLEHATSETPAIVGAGVADFATWIGVVVWLLLGTIAWASVFVGADDVLGSRPIDLLTILREGVARLGVLLLVYVYIAVAMLLFVMAALLLYALTGGLAGLLLIPAFIGGGVVLYFGWLFVFPAVVIDKLSARDAVVRSWQLVWSDPYAIAPLAITLAVLDLVEPALRYLPYVGGILTLVFGLVLGVVQALAVTKVYKALTAMPAPALEQS